MKVSNLKLEELLFYSNKITREQLDSILNKQKNSNKNIRDILVDEGYVTNNDIIEVLEFQLGIPYVDLNKYAINPKVVLQVPENIAKRYNLIAIDIKDEHLIVAMADPLNIFAFDDLKLYTNYEIQPVISIKESILEYMEKYYRKKSTEKVVREFTESYEVNYEKEYENEKLLEVTNAPVVKLINSIIKQAVNMRASDIHIEPSADDIRIRFRIDGDLQEVMSLSIKSLSALITRIKIMGRMDIAEKRIPQDGRIETKIDEKEIDMRISTIPTVYGEKVVLRLLNRSNFIFTKSELGFTDKNLKYFNKILEQPYGMILVTGPTGSGKTTTLYAILKELNKIKKNIITIEDPVEYKLKGINQIQINPKAKLTFSNGLRSILRQDPDIIMVGEIRDSETAKIAVRAAITGHLVLSTLHTNDSPSSIVRLIDMGIEPYLISSAVIGVISQRLVKKLCPKCKEPYEVSYAEKSLLGIDTKKSITLYKAKGCNNCNNGYIGRKAIHEVMIINEEIRRLINGEASVDELRNSMVSFGLTTLLNNSIDMVLDGVSTLEEILKVGFTME